VVLLEAEGISFWDEWLAFVQKSVTDQAFISPNDLSLFRIAHTAEDAVREIERFYANYQSARFIGNRLVLRLNRAPDDKTVQRLNTEFADLLTGGEFEVIPPTTAEVRDNDALALQRLAFYPHHAYGRIRQLIDVLNEL
jgi:hypothetical protein